MYKSQYVYVYIYIYTDIFKNPPPDHALMKSEWSPSGGFKQDKVLDRTASVIVLKL